MIVHYSIAAELASQRQQELARSFDSCQPRTSSHRRWWEPGFLRHPAAAHDLSSPSRVPATA